MRIRELPRGKKQHLVLPPMYERIGRYLERIVLQAGAGDSQSAIPLYKACGFSRQPDQRLLPITMITHL